MKSQLHSVILQLVLVGCSLLPATNATDQCNRLLDQCYQFKAQCSPDTMALKSCCDLTNFSPSKVPSGVYQVATNCSCGSPFTAAVDVYCDMETTDGGWMVIQRNKKGGVNIFNKKWKDYEEGFGSLDEGKLWYGLKALNCFTEIGQWELRVDFQFENKTWSHFHYNQFKVGSTTAEYPLTIGGFTGITYEDPFGTHSLNGIKFSTADDDNDQHPRVHCAASNDDGWWYNGCSHVFPNYQVPYVYFSSTRYNLLTIEMKIRQRNCSYHAMI